MPRKSHSTTALFTIIVILSFSFLLLGNTLAPEVNPEASLSDPSFSPDGKTIAFAAHGDIWTVSAEGGDAHILIAHPATESRPIYSPDGKYLAFVSTRTGNGDIYVLSLADGVTHRLTFDDATEQLDGWSPDSRWVYFSSSVHDINAMSDIFRVSVEGGTPLEVSADRFLSEFESSASPDGKSIVFAARGIANGQWWRNGHSHIDESEIWSTTLDGSHNYNKLVDGGAKHVWPMWSHDGKTLYYMSDESGAENIWSLLSGTKKQLTSFKNGRVLFPSISADSHYILFERDFVIWKLNLTNASSTPLKIALKGLPAGGTIDHRRISDRIEDMSIAPDGKKIAIAIRGDIFAGSAAEGGDTIRVTNTLGREFQTSWASDNHRVAYISDRDGHNHVYLFDFSTEKETQVTKGEGEDFSPRFSPDNKSLAYLRDRKQLVLVDLTSNTEKTIATGMFDRPPLGSTKPFAFSPDGKWVAYLNFGDRMYRNLFVVPVDGGAPKQISFLANVNGDDVNWPGEGRYIYFVTNQRTEGGQVAQIDLLPRVPKFREDQFRELFKDEKPSAKPNEKPAESKDEKKPDSAATPAKPASPESAAKDIKAASVKPVQIVTDGIRKRLTMLNIGLDIDSFTVSNDGKVLVAAVTAGGRQNLYSYSLEELPKDPIVAAQLTATPGGKRALQFTADNKEVYYLDTGRVNHTTIASPAPKPVNLTAEMDVDFQREKTEAFEQSWHWLRDNFFDEKMHGVDWDGLHKVYAQRVAASETGDEMRRNIALMIGELNASHSGINAPADERRITTGRLGLRFDRGEFEKSGKLSVIEVIPQTPADIAGIKVGDLLIAVNGTSLSAHENLEHLLEFTIDKRTVLSVTTRSDTSAHDVILKPVNLAAEKTLLYRAWVEENRKYVEKLSGGKLGYVHMPDMGSNSLTQLMIDLDTENQGRMGVVFDIRNNNGGFVNAYALDVLDRRGYLHMTFRGFTTTATARPVLGQRALELPTVLITNQHSLSDAEDFTEGYRTLGLGKVVGEPTAGWIIYTSNVPLIDGSVVRVPFIRVTDHEGKDMELQPRKVDVAVSRPVGESYTGKDSQLDVAIKVLVEQIEGKKH